jgi:hypothetical protein
VREILRNSSPFARVLLVLAAAFLLLTCVSLVKRAYRGDSDFGVFYRAAVSLANGAGGELYRDRDQPTGWYNCIPPAGMVAFMGLAYVHRVVAGILWAVVNLGLLAAAFHLLRRIYERMGEQRIHYEATLPYALVVLAVFGGVCLQTGQVSILFVVCWLGYILSTANARASLAGLLLAIPAAIKLYPLMFGLIPLLRRKWGETAYGIIWIAVLSLAVPAVFFRENLIELTTAFFQYQVFDPDGRVMTAAAPTAVSNQGLDAVLLRYFSYIPGLHDLPGSLPHGSVDPNLILTLSNVLRFAIVVFTTLVSIRWLRTQNENPPFLFVALWCAALYMILPGAKGRYAIYALPAILAMFAEAHRYHAAGRQSESKRIAVLAAIACALLVQLVPDYFLQFGVGYLGTLILYTFMVHKTLSPNALPRRTGENYTAGSKRASDIL